MNKNIRRQVVIVLCAIIILTLIDIVMWQGKSYFNTSNSIDRNVFPRDNVIDVKINIDEETYKNMIDNALAEEYVMADVNYNGYIFNDIGIRPKGNSSLRNVANSEEEEKRYSFKVNLDYYVDEQNLYGISKINLNNIYWDATMMAEYISYDILNELGANHSRTSYIALYINDTYKGLYLAVEEVDEAFLEERYGNATGELYKPERGGGSDLQYISDNPDDYELEPENKTSSNRDIIELMALIKEGSDIDDKLDIDSFLKYLAMSSVTVHLDAYQGGMYHNYYLYNNQGIFEWIAWDLNMAFNGFPKGGSDEEAVGLLIDEPVLGSMSKYPLIQAVLQNEDYLNKYHSYIEILLDSYLSEEEFTEKVTGIYEMIKPYVQSDPTAFYTYDEFEKALFTGDDISYSIFMFIEKRVENIRAQLNGSMPSTNKGEGNLFSKGGGMKPDQMKNKQGRQPPVDQQEQPPQKQQRQKPAQNQLEKKGQQRPQKQQELTKGDKFEQEDIINSSTLLLNIGITSVCLLLLVLFIVYMKKH